MGWGSWAIVFLIFLLLTPTAQLGVVRMRRRRALRRLEKERGRRVLPVVLSMGTVATYGLPLARFEELPLPHEVAEKIAATPAGVPLDIVVDLPAGLIFDAAPVVAALAARRGPTTLIVPRRALTSGVTLARAIGDVMLGAGAVVGEGGGADAGGPSEAPNELDAGMLRAAGMTVREGVPAGIDDLLATYAEPRRPRHRLPFYLALPRLPQPTYVDEGVVAGGLGPDNGAARTPDGS